MPPDDEEDDDILDDFLPSRKQFDTPEAWMTALCSVLWKTASAAVGKDSFVDPTEFDNPIEYEPIPIPGAFEFFRARLADEIVLMLTGRNSLDEFDSKVSKCIAPFLTETTEALCEVVLGGVSLADMRVYGSVGVRPSDNELVMRTTDISQNISTFLDDYVQSFDNMGDTVMEALTPLTKADRWIRKTSISEQEEVVAIMWAMLQLVAHHTDLRIPGPGRSRKLVDEPETTANETPAGTDVKGA